MDFIISNTKITYSFELINPPTIALALSQQSKFRLGLGSTVGKCSLHVPGLARSNPDEVSQIFLDKSTRLSYTLRVIGILIIFVFEE